MPPSPERLREMAHEAGFDLVRFGPADLGGHGEHFLAWLEAGRAGAMDYLHRNREKIAEPRRFAPAARSVVALAQDYGSAPVQLAGGGRIARYARGRDYHRALGDATRRLRATLERDGVAPGTVKVGTDAVPVLERALAVRAGIGFLAKSAMVISPQRGPYLFLSELLTPFDLPPDPLATGTCGTCTRCIDACPTQAIVAPHQVDARRCLSYTTIEHRGVIPVDMRTPQGEWLFGCDICLEVCPFTRFAGARPTAPSLQPHRVVETFTLVGVLELSLADYDTHWVGTAMRRATRQGLRRNAAVVLGNRGDAAAVPALARALRDADPIVRAHAAWALGRLSGGRAELDHARAIETEPVVLAEIDAALERG